MKSLNILLNSNNAEDNRSISCFLLLISITNVSSSSFLSTSNLLAFSAFKLVFANSFSKVFILLLAIDNYYSLCLLDSYSRYGSDLLDSIVLTLLDSSFLEFLTFNLYTFTCKLIFSSSSLFNFSSNNLHFSYNFSTSIVFLFKSYLS